MGVAIGGEIFQNPYLVLLNRESEIYLIPQNRRRLSLDQGGNSQPGRVGARGVGVRGVGGNSG
jgi:hypothetical protein